jgi:hypothetical protein
MGSLYQPTPRDEGSSARPAIIAVVTIVVVVVVIWVFAHRVKPAATGQLTEAPYAPNLQVSDLHMSTAKNFVGSEITYLEGILANTGPSTVTDAQVLCIFRNSMGEVVDQPVVSLQIEAQTLGQTEFVPLSASSLTPNQKRPFRLTFDHVSADWNMGIPELRFVSISTK